MEGDDLRPWRPGRRDREETEAGPSMALEESVVGNLREQKHSIFLSHSGAQKAFVRRLRNALERNAYFPFFDEDPDCLRKGEPFVQHIKDAARLADVAVVVLSNEFFNSKWPMIELAIFTEEQRRRRSTLGSRELNIVPLFMGLSVEEFRNQDRRLGWFNKWHELGVTDSRIDASKWEEALGVLGGINGIEYSDFRNEEEFINSIVSAILKLVPPDLKWEDTHVKGKLKLHQAAIEMFVKAPPHTRFRKVRTIGLYGVGGIGKTTICKSLCNYYFAEFNGKVWHAELGKKGAEEIQKDVLHHLVGTSETLLNQTVKCKDQWRSLLWRKMEYKVFLAIDNVWDEDISREQAECLLGMGFHPDSLVVITSRNRELLEWLGIHKECCFEMPELDKGDATAVLLQSAAPGCDIESMTDDQRVAVAQVVERCFLAKGSISDTGSEKHYVPLALEVLGRQLRLPLCGSSKKLTQWVDKLDLKWSNQRQHPIFSVLRLSYDNLPSSKHKRIFLDVALCAPRKQDNTSASVNEVCKWLSMVYCVGGDEILNFLEDLQRDGLIERWEYLTSPFGMHELYAEFAKAEAVKEENSNNQLYLYHEDGFDVPAIMQMFPHHNYWPLRRVHSFNGGFSKLSSEELRYMVHVEVLKLDFCFELKSLDLRCLKSLRSLEIRGCFDLQSVEGLEDLRYLKFFRWNTCRIPRVALNFSQTVEIVEIYGSKESEGPAIGSFEGCSGLLGLTLSRHPWLEAVPDLHKLHKLEKVDFSGCCRIKEVRGLEGLCRLKHLNLQNCRRLIHCYGFEKLVKIETLNLEGCENMQSPEVWDLTQLVNLRCINIGGALVVQELVFNSPYLAQLGVIGCKNLATVVLRTDSWTCLNRLNEDSDGTAQNWNVDCQSVVDHNSFDTYTTLNLSNCRTLESLDGIGSLRSLQCLYLRNCASLTSVGDLCCPGLKVIDLSSCSKLKFLGDFCSLRSLQRLDLSDCVSLISMPNLSHCSVLEVLNLMRCFKLKNFLRDVWVLTKPISLGNRVMVLGSSQLEELQLRGCANLWKVVLSAGCESWKFMHILNEKWAERALNSRINRRRLPAQYNFYCQDKIYRDSFDTYTTLNLSNCRTLESLEDIGSLRSLQCLYLRNCWALRTLSDLSSSPFLEVVDLSFCDSLEALGDLGPLRSLQYLYLRECGSLTSLGDLCSPALQVLDLSGCSKLECLGDFCSLRSLQRLDLSDCLSLISMPNLSHCPLLEVLDVTRCDNLMYLLHDSVDVWDLSKLKSLRSLDMGDNPVVRELVLGSSQLEKLRLSGCANLAVLSAGCESWKPMHLLNEKWVNGPLQSGRHWSSFLDDWRTRRAAEFKFYCEDKIHRDSFDTYTTLNLSNCHTLESLEDIGSLRSLQCLYLRNCWALRTLSDLSSSPFLEVVDLSFCYSLEVLGDLGPLRLLQYLYLRECGSLTSLGDLCSPDLKVIDLYGCSKLECLGDFCLLRSLETLDLSDCLSLISMPNLSHCSRLEGLNLMGCDKLKYFLDDTVDVWDLSKLKSLRSLDMSGNRVVRELVLGSSQLEELQLRGCANLRTVVLSAGCESWKLVHLLNEKWVNGSLQSGRYWSSFRDGWRTRRAAEFKFYCEDKIHRDSFDTYTTLNLSNCHTLESLEDIGSLRSLQYLYLQNCRKLRTLRDLSSSPFLKFVDLSFCCSLEVLGDLGPLRSLQYLFLQECESLISLGDLCSPDLKVIDLSGCSKLRKLGEFSSLISLQRLDLIRCVSLRSMPNLSHCSRLEGLNLMGCDKLTDYVWDLTKLKSFHLTDSNGNRMVCELVLQPEELQLRGWPSPKRVLFGCESWKHIHFLSEKWVGRALNSRNNCSSVADEGRTKRAAEYKIYLQNKMYQHSFDSDKTIDLSICHTLESLEDIGCLRSLQCLHLHNCRKLRTLRDLSSYPFLEVVDLSFCCSLEVLGDLGPLRSLQYLFLQECESLISLGDLCSPDLKVIDLSGCSKLECLGDFYSLRSLRRLDLSDCVSLISMPNLSHCSRLEVLDVTGCDKLIAFLPDLWDLSKLVSLHRTDGSGSHVVRELMLGRPRFEELED